MHVDCSQRHDNPACSSLLAMYILPNCSSAAESADLHKQQLARSTRELTVAPLLLHSLLHPLLKSIFYNEVKVPGRIGLALDHWCSLARISAEPAS